jgi:hypothetical protein
MDRVPQTASQDTPSLAFIFEARHRALVPLGWLPHARCGSGPDFHSIE